MAEEKQDLAPLNPERIPVHVAMIMDGNGRWAKQQGKPRLFGHRAGTENLRSIISACVEFGVRYLTIYAFQRKIGTVQKMKFVGF